MDILDHQEVLDHEIRLLDEPGQNLSNFHLYSPQQSIFVQPSALLKTQLQKQYRIDSSQLKTCLNHTNTSLQIFTSLLMKIFYQNSQRLDLLEQLKCTLYSSSVKIDEIKNMPKRNLSSNVMKKMLVEFFQVMQYHGGKAQIMLDKYPIVLQIFILFFRTILKQMELTGAQDFRSTFDINKAIVTLFDYFDFPYETRKGLYFLKDGELILYINEEENHIVYGQYAQKNTCEEEPDPQKDEFEFEMKFQNDFNFNSIGQSQTFENMENNSKDFSTPTPHFLEVQEDIGFNRKKQTKLSARRKYSRDVNKLKLEDEIMETAELEQIEDDKSQKRSSTENNIRDSLTSSLQLNGPPPKIYFEKDEQAKNLNGVQSPNPSSPSTDVLDLKDMKIMAQNKFQRSNRRESFNISQSLISDAHDNKSDIFPLDKRNSPTKYRRKQDDDMSIYSCSCSETRLKKNSLQSNVFDINFKKDFTKKQLNTPQSKSQTIQSFAKVYERVPKTQYKKAPQFLTKKNADDLSQSDKKGTNIQENFAFSRKSDGKPKIYFTYQQGQKNPPPPTNSMRSQHVYTEPANLQSKYTKSYQRETNRSNQVSPTPSNQGDQIKKIGNYEMQGNPRIYRNYVQQKIKYI